MLYRKLRTALKHQDWLAYFIELIIVILGITIAYQLNVFQQKSGEKKMKAVLLENLRLENQQNYEDFNDYKGNFLSRPVKLNQLIEMFDNQDINHLQQNDEVVQLLNLVESSVYYPIRESYLNTYLGNISEMKNDNFTRELIRLQSIYQDLNFLWKGIHEYRLDKIHNFTEIAYDRKTNKYDIELLQDKVFMNRLSILAAIEGEHARMFSESLKQMEKVDSLLNLE